jgi:hypothetical protein
MSGFVDGIVTVAVLIIAGVVIAFIFSTPASGGSNGFFDSVTNLWGKALNMMFGG